MRQFKNYNKLELLNSIDQLSIERFNDQIITKYGNRVLKTATVSNRYEIFDIVSYIKEKIETIEENFIITKYSLNISGGSQSLKLISDKINIGGIDFYKSFYIENSTDKSRRLSFRSGLHSSNFYCIGGNVGMSKKHLNGVTKSADIESLNLNGETFNQQIESIQSLIGHKVKLSNIREVILGDKEIKPDVNHRKFDAFKNMIRFSASDGLVKISNDERRQLLTPSESIVGIQNDFYLDAFFVFISYMKIFNKQDSNIIKRETETIMKITQCSIRNSILESLGI